MNMYIESLEGGKFIVSTGTSDDRKPELDNDGKPRTFESMDQIRSFFSDKKVDRVWMRQATPYEEMVGQPDEEHKALEMEIPW